MCFVVSCMYVYSFKIFRLYTKMKDVNHIKVMNKDSLLSGRKLRFLLALQKLCLYFIHILLSCVKIVEIVIELGIRKHTTF